MTTAELINLLQQLPPETEVWGGYWGGYVCDPIGAFHVATELEEDQIHDICLPAPQSPVLVVNFDVYIPGSVRLDKYVEGESR